jgi:cytochrome c-type biogenesis protein CcmF
MGVLVMAFGIIGVEFFQRETQVRLFSGDSLTLGRYTLWFNEVERYMGRDDLLITQASLDLYAGDRFVKTLRPKIELYTRTGQPMTIPDLRSTLFEDFYVIMINWEGVSADAATFKAYQNPLINWVWAGGAVFIVGTLVAAWPDLAESRVVAAARARRALRNAPLPASGD